MVSRSIYYISAITFFLLTSTGSLWSQEETSNWSERVQYQFSFMALLENDKTDIGADFKAWYFLKPKVGVGPSLAYLDYDTALNESLVNVGIDALFLTNDSKKVRPFGALNTGVGFTSITASGRSEIYRSRIFIAPRVGFYFLTDRGVAFQLGLGYIHQGLDASFDTVQADVNLSFSRYTMSFGIAF